MDSDILILEGLSPGQKACHVRLSLGLRQIDLASQAKCQPIEITRLEHDRYVKPTVRKRILAVLGLLETEGDDE